MPRDFGPKPPPGWPANRPWPPTSKADVSYLSLLGRDITRTSQGLAHAIKAVPGLAKEFYDYAQAHPIRAGLELAVPPVALGEMAGEVYKKGREGKIDLPNAGMLAMAGVAHVPVLSKLPKFRSAAIKLADGRVFEGALHFNAVEDAMSALRNSRPFKSGAERVRAVDKALAGATRGFTDEAGHFLNDQQTSQRLVKMGHKAFSEGGRVSTEEIPRKAWAGGAPGATKAKEPVVPRAVADTVWHGTPHVFENFERRGGDLGIHFGTKDQAQARLKAKTGNPGSATGMGLMIPAELDIKNPLMMSDVQNWNDIEHVRDGLKNLAFEGQSPFTHREVDALKSMDDARALIRKHGYDGVVYENLFETDRAALETKLNTLDSEHKALNLKVKTSGRKGLSPGDKKSLAGYEQQRTLLLSQIQGNGNTAPSFIALDPKQIKRYDNPGLTQQRADLFRSLQQEHPDWSVRKIADEIKTREINAAPKVLGDSAITKGVPAVRNLLTSLQRPDAINLPRVNTVDKARGAQMAKAYEGLPKNDPAAAEAYRTLNAEVEDQFKAMQKAGYTVEFVDHDPYKNSAEMMADVRDNKTLKVFKTGEGQQHPFMTAEQNNKFRAVHDWLAHAGEGHQFGPTGEENAYRVHASTLSPLARRALATETRGQNSWVNFGPHAGLPVTERPFAEQKAALWPEELTGDYDVMDKSAYRKLVNKTVAEGRALDTRQFTEDFKKKGGVVADSLYHGAIQPPKFLSSFAVPSKGTNTTFEPWTNSPIPVPVTRHAAFFADSPDFAKEYGPKVSAYARPENLRTAELSESSPLDNEGWKFVEHLYRRADKPLARTVGRMMEQEPAWALFDNDTGSQFKNWLERRGYNSAQFVEDSPSAASTFLGDTQTGTTTALLRPSLWRRLSPRE